MKQIQVHCSQGIKVLKVTQKVQIKGNTFRYLFLFPVLCQLENPVLSKTSLFINESEELAVELRSGHST